MRPPALPERPFHAVPAPVCVLRPLGREQEAAAIDPVSGELAFAHAGTLYLAGDGTGPARPLAELPAGYVSALHFLDDGALLFALESGGGLWRLERCRRRARQVLELSDHRSFVREGALARTPRGLFVGEYGLFPGARVANVWQSRDGGFRFECVLRFPPARHIHCLFPFPDSEDLLVTTGDDPEERVAWRAPTDGDAPRVWLRPWGGFTAAAASMHYLHLGTDLPEENALVRWKRGSGERPEVRRLPREIDLSVRTILALTGGRLLALLACDEGCERPDRERAALLYSADEGTTWAIVRRFPVGSEEAPDALVLGPQTGGGTLRLITLRTRRASLLELALEA